MTQKYMKVYPTTDDIGKTPIVVEDVGGLNGVNIEFSRKAIFNQVNVKDYGAVGDGITDDSDIIQSVLTENSGRIIYLPEGNYYISTGLIVGANTTIKAYGAKIINTNTNISLLTLDSGCKVYGLEIEGHGQTTYDLYGKGIAITGTSGSEKENITIKDCYIHNISSFAIYCNYANNVNIYNCELTNLGYCGVGGYSCNNVNVDHCHIKDVSGSFSNEYGVTFTSANEAENPRSQYCSVTNCLIEDVTDWEGIDTHGGKNIKIINNTIKGCSRGIVLKMRPSSGTAIDAATDCIVQNNTIYGGGNLGLYVNGTSDVYAENNNISNNTFINCGLAGQSAYEQGAISFQYTKNSIINNNIIINPFGDGIVMKRYNYGFVVNNNIITNVQNTVTGTYGIVSYVSGVGIISGNHIYLSNPSLNTYVGQVGISITGGQNNNVTLGINNSNCTTPLSVSTTAVNYALFGATGAKLYTYAGNPENNIVANIGSICINTNGGSNNTLYIKESGAGTNTGWVAK